MNRWRAHLAELQSNTFAPAAPVQNVQIVQKPAPVLTTEHFEQIEHPPEPLSAPQDGTWDDAHVERAAIVEYDGGAPRPMGEALARLTGPIHRATCHCRVGGFL